jgi:hypothetical protein
MKWWKIEWYLFIAQTQFHNFDIYILNWMKNMIYYVLFKT